MAFMTQNGLEMLASDGEKNIKKKQLS